MLAARVFGVGDTRRAVNEHELAHVVYMQAIGVLEERGARYKRPSLLANAVKTFRLVGQWTCR